MSTGSEVADAFWDVDARYLKALSAEELAQQVQARQVLERYIERVYDDVKATSSAHPIDRPEFSGLVSMRDLAKSILSGAFDAQ